MKALEASVKEGRALLSVPSLLRDVPTKDSVK